MMIDENDKRELADFIRGVKWGTRQWEVCGKSLCWHCGLEMLKNGMSVKDTLNILASMLWAAKPDVATEVQPCRKGDM